MLKHKKTKILYLHASAELYGSDLILYQLVTHLDRREYDPVVILPFDGPLVELLRRAEIPVLVRPLPVLRRSLLTAKGLMKFGVVFVYSIIHLARFIKSREIDIVHTNTSATWGGGVAARICQVPHVCSAMELVDNPLFVAKAMASMTSAFSDLVLTVSTAVKNHFVALAPFGKDKYRVLFPPVDTGRFCFRKEYKRKIRNELGLDDDTIVAGMAGRLNHWKGQDVFVRACARVLEKLENKSKKVHFLILGGSVPGREIYELELRNDISRLGLTNFVTAPGFKENIEEWLSAMDIFVLPSKWPEPSSTGVVAAMATGLPVIGTNIGGTPETVVHGETGLLVPPNNPNALADAIAELILNDSLRKTMAQRAKERAIRLYSIQTYVDYVAGCYRELMEKK